MLIRLAQDDDFIAARELTNRCWRTNYAGVVPAETLAMFLAGDGGERWRAYRERWGGKRWVAERDGRVVGYVATGPPRDEAAGAGDAEVYALFVDPDEQGRGTGKLLLDHALAHLVAHGFREAHLWVAGRGSGARDARRNDRISACRTVWYATRSKPGGSWEGGKSGRVMAGGNGL